MDSSVWVTLITLLMVPSKIIYMKRKVKSNSKTFVTS